MVRLVCLFLLVFAFSGFADNCRDKENSLQKASKDIEKINADLAATGEAASQLSLQSPDQQSMHRAMASLMKRAGKLQNEVDRLANELKGCP